MNTEKCTCKNQLEHDNCSKNCDHGDEPEPITYTDTEILEFIQGPEKKEMD